MTDWDQLETGSFAPAETPPSAADSLRVVSWNINRGLQLDGIIDFLANASADLILLQEADINARRTQRRNVAREIAQALKMDYVFGCEFEELSQGEHNSQAYHGQATFSRLPISESRILRFRQQSGFWRPRWYVPAIPKFQRRLGARMALVSHVSCFGKPLVAYNLHLESRGGDALRHSQLAEVANDSEQCNAGTVVVIAGDFNFDLSREPAVRTIKRAALTSPFQSDKFRATTFSSRLRHARAVDWILTRGPLDCAEPHLDQSTKASDHYPLSLVLKPKNLARP
jgi:endonuclease/exonuclease/phosphatase family metal-dependent hydrolase